MSLACCLSILSQRLAETGDGEGHPSSPSATPWQGGRRTEGIEKELLMEMGVAEQDIIEEVGSRDTFENGWYAKQIIDPQITQINADLKMKDQRTYEIIGKRGFKAPILVTSAYHMKRAVFLFEKQGDEG